MAKELQGKLFVSEFEQDVPAIPCTDYAKYAKRKLKR
jgi:hypothetical protein